MLCGLRFWDSKVTADFACQIIRNLAMTRHRRARTSSGIAPPRMVATLAYQNATTVDQMPIQVTAFHGWIATSS